MIAMWSHFRRKLVGPALQVVAGGLLTLFPTVGLGLLNVLGSGTGGIVAGSAAALIQSTCYGPFTCGVFPTCTSIPATATAPAWVISASVSYIAVGLWLWHKL
ncbi:hypothetical protein K443DRAFT_513191 [Laccaria amethystina LaAM-08-1]|uniref:Uncharacterized protein n=1 Tax=Laccaria amethystina LaAM-08-1 TaxID=1095629 RepID=A0A0C9WSE1_9AGAR|nr:hypothetical protein K443DRAFT_513191 [Laccaria amethystina LaAM-08-1]